MIERLGFEELAPQAQELLRARVQRLGYFGEYFQVAGHQPKALEIGLALMDELKPRLGQNVVELVALTQSARLKNDYERIQHERLAEKLGFSREWIGDAVALAPQCAEHLSPSERKVQALVIAMLESWGRAAQAELAAVAAEFGSAKTTALLLLIGKYASDSLFMNVLQLTPPAPLIFAESVR